MSVLLSCGFVRDAPAGFPRQPSAGTVPDAPRLCNRQMTVHPDCQQAAHSSTLAAMKPSEQKRALDVAVKAARAAGALMLKNFREPKKVNETAQYDIKLELDVKCQQLIEKKLASVFPKISVMGEEGDTGDSASE